MYSKPLSLLAVCASLLVLSACTTDLSGKHQYFSEHHQIPLFGVESYEPHWPNGHYIHIGKHTLLRVIHDQPGSLYASPRTILLYLDASPQTSGSILAWLMIDDIHGEEIDFDQPPFNQPVYYLQRIDAQGNRSGFSGPYHKAEPPVASLLTREIDLTRAFPDEDLAAQAVAFIQDMKFMHGGKHRVYNDAPYVIDWRSVSRAILRKKNPELERKWPSSSVDVLQSGIYVWAPVLAAQGDFLGRYDGALSTGMSFEDGRITGLWIDMN